jgi:hypothetical protein
MNFNIHPCVALREVVKFQQGQFGCKIFFESHKVDIRYQQKDQGGETMTGYVGSIEQLTSGNNYFRQVLFAGSMLSS